MRKLFVYFICLILVLQQLLVFVNAETTDNSESVLTSEVAVLNAGVTDTLIVDTTSGALSTSTGKKTYKNTQITSLASLNDGVCASLVDDDWHWLNSSSDFYNEVTSVDNFVYSANNWSANTVPQIIYNIVPKTKISFKIALRKELTDWADTAIEISQDGNDYYTPTDNFISYTSKEYECSNYGTMEVRFYELTSPIYGKLKISLPTAQSIMDRTVATINSDNSAFVTASALLIPASSSLSDIKYVEPGVEDYIPTDISGWKSSLKTAYGTFTGGIHIEVPTINSSYKWGNSSGDVTALMPELKTEKVFLLDYNNPFTLTYDVAAGTTFVLPVIMKSNVFEVLNDANNIVFTIDDSTGTKTVTPEYVEVSADWSYKTDIDLCMRKYSVYCKNSAVLTISISKETLARLDAAAKTINSGSDYLKNSALVYPAYGLEKIATDVIKNNGAGTSIHNNTYLRSNAISSSAHAVNDAVSISEVTSNWLWYIKDTRFYDMVAKAGEYVYSIAYDKDKSPQIYYAFDRESTVTFKVGIVENVAYWDEVAVEYSTDGNTWEIAESRWISDSYDRNAQVGIFSIDVRFYEVNIPDAGFLRITLPNGKIASTNWNININSNNQIIGYCVFASGITATDGCYTEGDLDNDGNMTSCDLVLLRKILLNGEFKNRADINEDHSIDARDIVRYKKTIAEIPPKEFSLINPSSNEIMTSSLNPKFSWEESVGADKYTLRIQKFDEDLDEFSDVLMVEDITVNNCTLDSKQTLKSNEIYRWQVAAYNSSSLSTLSDGENGEEWNYFLTKTDSENSNVNSGMNFTFDGSVSQEVLCNYLSRSVTMTGALNFLRYADYSEEGLSRKRDILYSGAKYISRAASVWEPTVDEINRMANQKAYIDFIHSIDPEIVFEACIFEYVTDAVNEINIPEWVFTEFGLTPETRNFDFSAMVSSGNLPDISKQETQMFFYYRARTYIDAGYEALHFGQIVHMAANDYDDTGKVYYQATTELFNRIRTYAKANARRHFVFINAHTPYSANNSTNQYDYIGTDGYLLFDFHVFPIRATTEETESHATTEENPQTQILKVGNSNSIYCRTPGGKTHSGWECESIPYFVELDNAYVGDTDHTLPTPNLDLSWGKDDISWFASQPRSYRHYWLDYAYNWVKSLDDNGYLCMPLYRPATSADVALQGNYYVATHDFFSVSQTALSDISKMRYIWQQSK